MLTPLFNRVIIKPLPKKDKLIGGIIVANTGFDKTEEIHGEVIAVGKDVAQVEVGLLVSIPAYGYDSVSDPDSTSLDNLMCIREADIIAIITK